MAKPEEFVCYLPKWQFYFIPTGQRWAIAGVKAALGPQTVWGLEIAPDPAARLIALFIMEQLPNSPRSGLAGWRGAYDGEGSITRTRIPPPVLTQFETASLANRLRASPCAAGLEFCQCEN